MSCGVYAEGETDHSGPFSVLTHARHWQIGAAGPEELGQICHTSQPQPGLMHIPSKCTRAIVNRVSLYHRGTMRVEILARSFLTNPKAFSDRVQMCVVLFVWWMLCRLLRLCNCAFTVLTRPPTTPQHQDSNLNLPKTWSLVFCCMHCTGVQSTFSSPLVYWGKRISSAFKHATRMCVSCVQSITFSSGRFSSYRRIWAKQTLWICKINMGSFVLFIVIISFYF